MTDALDYLKAELHELEASGLLLRIRTLENAQAARARYDGRDVINLASNNYLALCGDPRMKEAAAEAARRYGAGSGPVRSIAGTMSLHRELQRRFAAFKCAEDAAIFPSGSAVDPRRVP